MKGIRTIALRLTGTKEAAEELEEMGEDTSDMIMSQSKMRDLIMNATKVASNNYKGFDIQDELGRYKSTYEIMLGLSQIWDEIQQADFKTGDNRQNLLLESIAGKNRASIAASILQNPDTLQSVYQDSSTKAADSAMKENEKYLASISGHLAKLKNAWQEMWASAANREVINGIINLATAVLKLVNDVGLLGSAFAVVWGGSILKGLTTANSWLVKFVRGLDNAKVAGQGFGDTLHSVFTNIGVIKPDDTRFKGLAQIQKERADRANIPASAPVTTGSSTVKDTSESVAKNMNAEASRNAAQANLEQATSEQVLQAAQMGNTEAETAGTAAKIEGSNASQQATQGNIQEAEAAELAAKAIRDKSAAEIEAAEMEAINTAARMSPKSVAKYSAQYNKELMQAYSKASKETMDWSMGYIDGTTDQINNSFDEVEKSVSNVKFSLAGLATNPMTWLIGIPALIGAVNIGLSAWNKYQQGLIDGAHEATNAWNENKSSLDTYVQQYQDLHKQLENVNLSEEEQTDIKKQLFDLQKQITDEYGNQVKGVNLVNGNLDEQIAKLKTINKEQASNNLGHNAKEYKNAVQEIEKQREYNIQSLSALSTEDFESLTNGLSGTWKKYIDDLGDERGLTFVGNALEAEDAMDELYERLSQKQDELGERWKGSIYESLMTSVESAIQKNDETITKFKDDYNSYLEQSIYAQNGTFGTDKLSAGEVLIEAQEAVNNYNAALVSGDTSQIDKTEEAFHKVEKAANEVVKAMGDERFERPFDDIFNQVDQAQVEFYNTKKKFEDPKVKNIVESVLGSPQENKKSAKDIPDYLRSAAEEILDEQEKARKWGMKSLGVDPLSGISPETKFGNVDMNNRPVIEWNKAKREQFAEALKSWNYMPEDGMVDTVFGGSGEYNGIGIAFTPILKGENGEGVLLSAQEVNDYIQNVIAEATDKKGHINLEDILEIDASGKNGKGGKGLIANIDGLSKYTSQAVGKIMHFSGTKGSIYMSMERLSEAAQKAGVDVNKVLEILQKTSNVDALTGVFDNFKYDVTDLEGYLSDLSNLPPQVADDILTIADAFGITADSSAESISAVAELLGSLGYVATGSMDIAGESFNDFVSKASGWIEETSNLSSVFSKGQGVLTFTKTQDDQGHEIASEVKTIADAYKELPGYDFASLFEETSVGIMVNADALRALQAQEESMRHTEFYEKRADLMEKLKSASGELAESYRNQIEELDMLWSAYSGATSALSKYQTGHGAADYSTNYKLFRDQLFKEGDEYLTSGEIGEEGFRRIAQLFSYKDLALASAEEVKDAYTEGADAMQRFFTENPVEGANAWIDEILQWPEEYGKVVTDEMGNITLEMTDQNLDAVAKHYGVSKDLILALMNELNATGSKVHFFTDGQLQQFDALQERAASAQKRLEELKTTATDPNLSMSEALDFNLSDLNTVDELQAKIENIKKLRANPNIDSETASLLDEILQACIDKLGIIDGTSASPEIKVDNDGVEQAKKTMDEVEERVGQLRENNKLGFNFTVEDDDKLRQFSEEVATWPEELQTKIAGITDPTHDPEKILEQWKEKYNVGIDVPIKAKVEKEPTSIDELKKQSEIPFSENLVSQWIIKPEVLGDENYQKLTNGQPEEKKVPVVPEVQSNPTYEGLINGTKEGKVHMGLQVSDELQKYTSGEPIHSEGTVDFQVGENEAEEVKEDFENKEVEAKVAFNPKNTIQDVVNQAGGNQPAVVNQETNKTETVNHVENYQANTSGLEAAKNKLQELMGFKGQQVDIRANVSGASVVDTIKKKIEDLVAKGKSKVNVTVNGNATSFNKAYTDTITKLNDIAKKDTTAKIKGDNSNLKDKVSEAKDKLNSINDKKVHITASSSGFDTITSWKNSVYDKLNNKTVTITTNKVTNIKTNKIPPINGTAHVSGTIMSSGHAYASGNWGLPRAEKGSLINEIGPELVVNSRTGKWQILNNGYPTFANFNQGDIIFNAKQTEDLLNDGFITGSYAKLKGNAFVSGTVNDEELEGNAFVTGTTGWNGALSGQAHGDTAQIRKAKNYTRTGSTKKTSSSTKSSGGNHSGGNHSGGNHSNNNNNNKSSKDFLQTLDAIEIQLQRVDAELQRLETNANKTFESFTSRAKSFNSEIHTTKNEIKQLEKSFANTKVGTGAQGTPANYFRKARLASTAAGYKSGEEGANKNNKNMTGQPLTDFWIDRIQNSIKKGQYLTLNDVHDEGIWKKIQAYQTWYEKGIKLQQKRQEYLNKLNQLTIAHLQLTQKSYETEIAYTNEQMNTNQQILEKQSALEKNATLTYLNNNINYDTNKKEKYKSEKTALQNELDRAVKNGYIKKNSEEWYTWMSNIQKLETQIVATENDIIAQTNKKLEYIQEKWQSALDMLDKTAEEYDIRIERQNSKQLISRTYTAGKNKGKYTPTKADYDNVIKLYDLLNKNEEKRRENLQKERNELQNQLDQAKKDKRFEKGSQEYQKWLGEIKDLDNQILEVENNIVENIVNKLEYIQDKWDAILDHFSATSDRLKEFADLQSAQGYEVSRKYYQRQIQQINPQIKAMQQEASDLQNQLNEAVKSGNIVTYSSEWYEWATNIEDIRNDIVGLQKDIVDLNNDIRQLGWDRFDEAQDTIKGVIEEMEFLSDLIRDDDLFDDKGMPTEKAQASAALIAQQYDLLMEQANRYAHKVTQLNKQLANDPYNKTLIKQRNEWLESQQDSIKAAQQQKEAMVDLAEKGIKKQIEAMNELISKYEEALDKQRSQEQYAKGIADKQKSISNLEKQLRSMGGDDSEEGKARRQQLRDQLKQAQQDLKDTQEDKRISDIKEALKEMQDKYEEVLNDRLKNIDALFKEAIDRINQNGTSIVDTIKSIGDSVNYTFSAELAKTYEGTKNTNKNDSSALVSNTKSNGTFVNDAATTLSTVAKIVKDTEKAMAASDITASNKIKSATTTTVKPTTTTKKKSTATTKKSTTTKKKTTATTKKTTTTKKKTTTTKKKTTTKKSTATTKKGTTTTKSSTIQLVYKPNATTTRKATSGVTLVNKPKATINGSIAPLKDSATGSVAQGSKTPFTATTKKITTTTRKTTTTTKKTTTTTKRTTTTAAKPKNGTYTENGKKVYYYNGVKKTGLFYGTDGRKRLVDGATGTLVKGWRTIGGVSTYYFDSSGRAVIGLHTINGAQYYFNEIAILKKGTFTVGNTTYTTDKNGKILSKKSATTGHLAKGTANVKRSGMYEVDEHGGEVFINKNGKIYTRLDKGSTVLPHDAAINLLKGMSDPLGFITSHMDLHPNNTTTNNNTGDTTNYITFNIPNVTNYSEFMREAQRDPNFTKYIQEISLGKLNGNNSLKGNSIRFR